VLDAQGVCSPPQRLTSQFKALGNNGRLFSLFYSFLCNKKCLEGNMRHLFCKSIFRL